MASICDKPEYTLNVASYNSKRFSDNGVEIIKELLAYNNIVFIQEHWQFEEQFHKRNIDNRPYTYGYCCVRHGFFYHTFN